MTATNVLASPRWQRLIPLASITYSTPDTAAPRLIHLHCNTTRQPPGLA